MKAHTSSIITAITLCCLLFINSKVKAVPEVSIPPTGLRCAPVFNHHAILQQGTTVHLWGWAEQGAKVTVTLGENHQTAVANKAGQWNVNLAPMTADKLDDLTTAPQGRPLHITALKDGKTEKLTFNHILIGEVWLCSGQSNMAGKVRNNHAAQNPNEDLAKLNLPALRQYRADLGWSTATPGPIREFTRVGLCFARKLQQELKVPVGILSASVGGTSIETWIRPTDVTKDPTKKHALGSNYLKHITPLVGTSMRGALWYQGEGNVKDGLGYYPKLKTLIDGWRGAWKMDKLPFLVVQLAGIGTQQPKDPAMAEGRAHIREAQFQILEKIPHTGLATAIDIGGPKEHPANKREIGIRLAHWALHHQYAKKQISPSGPIYQGFKIEGNSIRILFKHAEGLMIANKEDYLAPVPAPDSKLPWLSIQDKDGSWHWAKATIDGKDLIVSSPEVKQPIAVRFATTNRPLGAYLYNATGLPAFPFATKALAK